MAPSRVRIPPSPLAQRPPRVCAHPRRGGRAVECGGLENRYPSLGGSRVQIPPPPLNPTRTSARYRVDRKHDGAAEGRAVDLNAVTARHEDAHARRDPATAERLPLPGDGVGWLDTQL